MYHLKQPRCVNRFCFHFQIYKSEWPDFGKMSFTLPFPWAFLKEWLSCSRRVSCMLFCSVTLVVQFIRNYYFWFFGNWIFFSQKRILYSNLFLINSISGYSRLVFLSLLVRVIYSWLFWYFRLIRIFKLPRLHFWSS